MPAKFFCWQEDETEHFTIKKRSPRAIRAALDNGPNRMRTSQKTLGCSSTVNWALLKKKRKKYRINLYERHGNRFWLVILVNRFLTISTNGKQKKKPKREENVAWNQSNSATLVQHSKREQNNPCARPEDGFIQKNRSGNYESDHKCCKYTKLKWRFQFLFIAVVFCFEREFQMHNLTFHFSPRASRLLCVNMNLSYLTSINLLLFFPLIYETDVTTLLYMPRGRY